MEVDNRPLEDHVHDCWGEGTFEGFHKWGDPQIIHLMIVV